MNLRIAVGLLAALLATSHQATCADERPNILWIYLEDVSGWFSCYGDTVIDTPQIDALAKVGTRFERFYTPAGVCSATRSAIVTGMMQTSIGAHHHRSCRDRFPGEDYDRNVLPEGIDPLPAVFRRAGYYTFNEGGKDDYNFEFDADELYDFRTKTKGWGPGQLVAGECWSRRKDGQPFFGQVQLGGGKLRDRAAKVVQRYRVPVPPYYPDVAEVREEIAHHYDCILETDKQVGDIVSALRRDGLYDQTVIFLFSDHGYKLHRHKQYLYEGGIHMPLIISGPGIAAGEVRDDLISGIDIAAASLAVAGIQMPHQMEGRDFLAAGYTPRDFVVAARDRCDFTIEHIRAIVTPRFKYIRNYTHDRPWMQPTYKDHWPVSKKFRQMMAAGQMNETQLLFFDPDEKPAEELYELSVDRHEILNLAEDPEYTMELKRHRKLLEDWEEATSDQGQAPESDLGLLMAMKRWGKRCVNPEYDRIRPAYAKWRSAKKKKAQAK